ncbi:transcriptional regulator with XRE-family HTH domain [Rhizobium petrolearium]|uniref:helix-turn-helix domain-containing protein n=1 Tax=Neorhizobium petrolearium TaxID=515361 RepID=UPI001F16CC43|nr:helix-turn-helix transcriptional regulator [Neorhizobium petrolearium]MBP1847996.1 transcriptional regulator with XRE-family HTH domain [Neorhizobium petrolearium]
MVPAQLRMARAALKIGVRDLAEMAGVTTATITRFENERGGLNSVTVQKLKDALEASGIVFIPENGGGVGVRLKFNRREVKAIDVLENEGGTVGEDDV